MNKTITIIAGLPRCGSSLTLQMLNAAGVRCAGDYPSFEPDEILESPTAEFIDSFEGGALKILDPQRVELPKGRAYRFIFLTRSRRQQAQSIIKLIQACGAAKGIITESGFERMRESLRIDQAKALTNVQSHGCPILRIRFEDLIERPDETAPKIADYLGMEPEQTDLMRAVILPRSAQCYGGLIELQLMKELQPEADSRPSFDPLQCECNMPPYKVPCLYCETAETQPEPV